MEQPVLRNHISISPIWILPLVALCIGGWLLYTGIKEAGIDITVTFASAEWVTAGKTRVMYKGITAGTVTGVRVKDDLKGVIVSIEMDPKTAQGLVEDTRFWIVKPEITAGRVTGLSTLLSGSYIAMDPGKSDKPCRNFVGLDEPPTLPLETPGLRIVLRADKLYSLQKGSKIYSNHIQIGSVIDYELQSDNTVAIRCFIKPEFSHLVREGTRFWNASGISLKGNLQQGFRINVESLAALIYGGISCATPPALKDTPPAPQGYRFELYKNFEDAQYGIPMTLQLASGYGIVEGKTRVMYRGLKAGVVKKIDVNEDPQHTVSATILLDPRAEPILRAGTRFWVIRPQVSVDGIRHLDTLISGPYISFIPGDGPFQDHFTVQPGPMPKPVLRPGTRYVLTAKDSGSLYPGAPVLYKKLEVGEVTGIDIAPDDSSVHIELLVYEEYAHLVHTDSLFWNVSGLELDASLSKIKMNLASLKAMLTGGVAFTNPGGEQGAGEAAPAGAVFTLYEDYAAALAARLARPESALHLRLIADKLPSVSVGAPVLYQNLKVGEVTGFRLASALSGEVEVDVLIYRPYRTLVTTNSRFYNISGFRLDATLSGLHLRSSSLESIVAGGIGFYSLPGGVDAKEGQEFRLYPDQESSRYDDQLHIELTFSTAEGIRERMSVRYRGIRIGTVARLQFTPGLKEIRGTAHVRRDAAHLFRQTTRVNLVRPVFDLSGIHHLETILSGPYIEVVPGEGPERDHFHVHSYSREGNFVGRELTLILETDRLGSLKRFRPVYYRQVPVGRITDFTLSPSARKVWVTVKIDPPYAHLVHRGSKFWNSSGILVSGGLLSQLTVEMESMESLLAGGVSFATPEGEAMGEPAQDNDHFVLYDRKEEEWLQWSPDLGPVSAPAPEEPPSHPAVPESSLKENGSGEEIEENL